MARFFCVLAIGMAILVKASAFMLASPTSLGGSPLSVGVSGAAVSNFAGSTVCHREVVASDSTLRMMRHRKRFKKLNMPADQRKAMLRGLTTEIIRHGRIKTTLPRAKAVRKRVDHMITLSKNGSLHARRQALAYMYDKQLVHALFEAGGDRYGERNGGYCRVTKTLARKGDNAPMAFVELV